MGQVIIEAREKPANQSRPARLYPAHMRKNAMKRCSSCNAHAVRPFYRVRRASEETSTFLVILTSAPTCEARKL